MQLTEKHREYWKRNLNLTLTLLAIWFVVTFVMAYFARPLAQVNIAGFPFVNRASAHQCQEMLNLVKPVLLNNELAEGMMWVDLNQAPLRDRRLLFERHLISKHLAEADHRRAVSISGHCAGRGRKRARSSSTQCDAASSSVA